MTEPSATRLSAAAQPSAGRPPLLEVRGLSVRFRMPGGRHIAATW